MTAAPTRAVDIYLDAIRLIEATMHGDVGSYNAITRTTTATPSEIVYALATLLAAGAAQHADPDQAIRDLRAAFVRVTT